MRVAGAKIPLLSSPHPEDLGLNPDTLGRGEPSLSGSEDSSPHPGDVFVNPDTAGPGAP
jgi:hypothetical protein